MILMNDKWFPVNHYIVMMIWVSQTLFHFEMNSYHILQLCKSDVDSSYRFKSIAHKFVRLSEWFIKYLMKVICLGNTGCYVCFVYLRAAQ